MKHYVLSRRAGCRARSRLRDEQHDENRHADDDEKVTVTGSRIPRKDRNAAGVKSTTDKNAIKDMMKPNAGGGMPS